MTENKTAIIAGASGQVGGYLLDRLLNSENYARVIALVRKPLNVQHPKLQQIEVDFSKPDSLKVAGTDVFCCLGTTIKKAKTKENFAAVDYGYPMALAHQTKEAGAKRFFSVSSMGASMNSSIFYARVKGELEEDLKKTGFDCIAIFRPSMLLGPRKESRIGESIGKFLMQVFAVVIPAKYKGVHADQVAAAMCRLAETSPSGIHLVENPEILKAIR
jgi:uncharacterized protein YbjT (DUF2867 family)